MQHAAVKAFFSQNQPSQTYPIASITELVTFCYQKKNLGVR